MSGSPMPALATSRICEATSERTVERAERFRAGKGAVIVEPDRGKRTPLYLAAWRTATEDCAAWRTPAGDRKALGICSRVHRCHEGLRDCQLQHRQIGARLARRARPGL